MDIRYQIEEMVSQDSKGVVFQGVDTVTGMIVAMRRFISAGCGGEEMSDRDCQAFSDVIAALKKVTHPCLRRVLAGGCDPVDDMPYLITRWTGGSPLSDLLANEELLDSGFARHILHQLLDTASAISESLGKEGQWLEASLESIMVRPPRDEGAPPTALFWLYPLAWLRASDPANDLMGLADLGEAMLGGPRKIATKHPDDELAKWINRIRDREITTLHEAKESLKAADSFLNPFSANSHPPDHAAPVETDGTEDDPMAGFDSPGLKINPTPRHLISSRGVLPPDSADDRKGMSPAVIASAVAMIGLIIFVSWIATGLKEADPPEAAEFSNTVPTGLGQRDGEGTMMPVRSEIRDSSAEEERLQYIQRRGYYTINEADLLFSNDLKEVTFRGRLARVRMSSSGLTMYLDFSEEAPIEEPRAYAMARDLVDGIRQEDLEPFVGRQIEIRGLIDIEDLNGIRRPRIKIIDRHHLHIVEADEDFELR